MNGFRFDALTTPQFWLALNRFRRMGFKLPKTARPMKVAKNPCFFFAQIEPKKQLTFDQFPSSWGKADNLVTLTASNLFVLSKATTRNTITIAYIKELRGPEFVALRSKPEELRTWLRSVLDELDPYLISKPGVVNEEYIIRKLRRYGDRELCDTSRKISLPDTGWSGTASNQAP